MTEATASDGKTDQYFSAYSTRLRRRSASGQSRCYSEVRRPLPSESSQFKPPPQGYLATLEWIRDGGNMQLFEAPQRKSVGLRAGLAASPVSRSWQRRRKKKSSRTSLPLTLRRRGCPVCEALRRRSDLELLGNSITSWTSVFSGWSHGVFISLFASSVLLRHRRIA